ncbi:4206_t:CDS:10, partial [Acaulospora morrowiae]
MGIQCLLQSLKSIQTNISIAKYSGTTVGVDAYCWLHKGIHTCMSELVWNRPTTKYVDYCMKRVQMLKSYGVRPFIVFDGGLLPAKLNTETKRKLKREEYRRLGQELFKKGRVREARNFLEKSVDVTPEMAYKFIQALRAEKVEYMVAPYEADAQLAYLEKKDRIKAIITEDSDLLVFGCKTVIYKLDSDGSCVEICRDNFGKVQEINMVGWTDVQFRHMTMLSGCDYLPSIVGIGLKSAYKYIRRYRTADKVLVLLRADGRLEIPPDYLANFKRAEMAFLYQRVFDIDTQRLVTLNPIPEGIDITQDNEYIGSDLEPIIAAGIATGDLNPFTKQPMLDVTSEGAGFGPEYSSEANWYSVIPTSYGEEYQVAFQSLAEGESLPEVLNKINDDSIVQTPYKRFEEATLESERKSNIQHTDNMKQVEDKVQGVDSPMNNNKKCLNRRSTSHSEDVFEENLKRVVNGWTKKYSRVHMHEEKMSTDKNENRHQMNLTASLQKNTHVMGKRKDAEPINKPFAKKKRSMSINKTGRGGGITRGGGTRGRGGRGAGGRKPSIHRQHSLQEISEGSNLYSAATTPAPSTAPSTPREPFIPSVPQTP